MDGERGRGNAPPVVGRRRHAMRAIENREETHRERATERAVSGKSQTRTREGEGRRGPVLPTLFMGAPFMPVLACWRRVVGAVSLALDVLALFWLAQDLLAQDLSARCRSPVGAILTDDRPGV